MPFCLGYVRILRVSADSGTNSLCKSQEKASGEIQGEFFPTKSWVNFAGDLLVDFFGPLPWKKQEEKSTKNPRQDSNQNLGVSRQKSTLQGSGLEQ